MVLEFIHNIRNKHNLYSRKQKHLRFVGQRLYDLHSEITNESMELHKLKGIKLNNKGLQPSYPSVNRDGCTGQLDELQPASQWGQLTP